MLIAGAVSGVENVVCTQDIQSHSGGRPAMLVSRADECRALDSHREREFNFVLPPLFSDTLANFSHNCDNKLLSARVSAPPATPALCLVSSPTPNFECEHEDGIGEMDSSVPAYRSALCISNTRHGLCFGSPRSQPLSSDKSVQDPLPDETSQMNGAFKNCEARVKRLDKLNAMLETLAIDSWSSSENRQMLHQKLKKNKYYRPLKSSMLAVRLQWIQTNSEFLSKFEHDSSDSGLVERSMKGGVNIGGEITSLRMIEEQTLQTITAMLGQMSEDIPVCGEEVKAALARAKSVYDPAKNALMEAVDRAISDKGSSDQTPRLYFFRLNWQFALKSDNVRNTAEGRKDISEPRLLASLKSG